MIDIPIYEEVQVKCVGCGKNVKVLRYKDSREEDFLCQKCGGFGGGGTEEDSDE